MSFRNVAVAYPGKETREIFRNGLKVAYFDEARFVTSDGEGFALVGDFNSIFETGLLAGVEVTEIRQLLRSWLPIWNRYVSRGHLLESFLDQTVLFVLRLISNLRANGIRTVLAHTSSPHHPETVALAIACQISGVQQVYLYLEPVAGRLLPLKGLPGFGRQPVGASVSKFNYERALSTMKVAAESGISSSENPSIGPTRFGLHSSMYALTQDFMSAFRRVKSRRSLGSAFPGNEFYVHSGLSDFELVRRQKVALEVLEQKLGDHRNLGTSRNLSDGDLVIFAHFQPEATSFPESWEISSHVDLVCKLRLGGFEGNIWYREHPSIARSFYGRMPTRVGMYRSAVYYELLSQLGVRFLDSREPLDAEISGKVLVVTLTGTIAIERALQGLTTLVVGQPWYEGLPGTMSLEQFGPRFTLQTERLESVAAGSKEFLHQILSGKTLENCEGIGTARPQRPDQFLDEYRHLLEELNRWD